MCYARALVLAPQLVRSYTLKILSSLCCFSLALVLACGGSSRKGILQDVNGNALSDIVLRLITVDDQGNELAVLGSTSSDEKGEFMFSSNVSANASVVIEAALPSGLQHGFFAGSNDAIPVTPMTEALFRYIIEITKTTRGRNVTDFSSAELREITQALLDADASSINTTMQVELQAFINETLGREIAIASGAVVLAGNSSNLEAAPSTSSANFIQDTDICRSNAAHIQLDSDDFHFGIKRDGALCSGTHQSLGDILSENSFDLLLTPDVFIPVGNGFPDDASPMLENQRVVAFAAGVLQTPVTMVPDDLEIQRKVYVPSSGDVIRFLEIFRNVGSVDRDITFQIHSLLETGSESQTLLSDGVANQLETSDRYLVAYDSDNARPSVGFFFQDGTSTLGEPDVLHAPGTAGGQANEVSYQWTVSIPANSVKTFVHYGFLSTSRDAQIWQELIESYALAPDMTNMNIEELAGLLNFAPSVGNIVGEAGLVAPGANVTIAVGANTTSLVANSDGSFFAAISASAGDTVDITADDGLVLRMPIE